MQNINKRKRFHKKNIIGVVDFILPLLQNQPGERMIKMHSVGLQKKDKGMKAHLQY